MASEQSLLERVKNGEISLGLRDHCTIISISSKIRLDSGLRPHASFHYVIAFHVLLAKNFPSMTFLLWNWVINCLEISPWVKAKT